MKRKYELKERARRQAETRQRIVDATVELHTSVGPAQTTVSAIANRAGVERHTVYAHFPDEASLFQACIAHWQQGHPQPDLARWFEVEEPEDRLRGVLTDLYGWYAQVEPDLEVLTRGPYEVPAHAEEMQRTDRELQDLANSLARDWPRRKAVRAAIGHALQFETWRSLVRREGLSKGQAVDAMARLVASSG